MKCLTKPKWMKSVSVTAVKYCSWPSHASCCCSAAASTPKLQGPSLFSCTDKPELPSRLSLMSLAVSSHQSHLKTKRSTKTKAAGFKGAPLLRSKHFIASSYSKISSHFRLNKLHAPWINYVRCVCIRKWEHVHVFYRRLGSCAAAGFYVLLLVFHCVSVWLCFLYSCDRNIGLMLTTALQN